MWLIIVGFLLFQLPMIGNTQQEITDASASSIDADTRRFTLETDKPFDDVIEDIEFAISQHNYRLTGRNNVGSAISSMDNKAYGEATVLHFCNIQAAKEIIEINPLYFLHMPCRITVHEQGIGKVIIDARLVPENDPQMHSIAIRVNNMMRDITRFGAD